MAKITPKTYYEWLMVLNQHRLKVAPMESFGDERFNHAVARGAASSSFSYGMWCHRTDTGWVDPDALRPKKEVTPAPPIPDGDKEWDV